MQTMDIQKNKSAWKLTCQSISKSTSTWNKVLGVLFSLVLFFLPFWNANEGVDYADIGYSLNNYAHYDSLGTTWKLATYLANCLGRFFMWLPGGDTLLGMNLYTSLLISGMALAGFYFCRRFTGQTAAFFGEVLAVSLCWCPTVILYNYLTYVLMLAALLCLYHGLTLEQTYKNTNQNKNQAVSRKKWFLAAAGVLLGMNVFVRFSNLAEIAFILLVWYAAWLSCGKQRAKSGAAVDDITQKMKQGMSQNFRQRAAGDTLWCIAGYIAGFLTMFIIVCANYGLSDYLHMLTGMSSMEGSSKRYSLAGMITGPFLDYLEGGRWLMLLLAYLAAGLVLFCILPGRFEILKKLLFLSGMPLVYQYFWGHAMFSFDYYSYGAMFWPTILVIIAAIALCVYCIVRESILHESCKHVPAESAEEEAEDFGNQLLPAMVLLIIFVTPLGSNNRSYPVMNNLFLVMPFVLVWGKEFISRFSFPVKATTIVYMLFFAVQVVLFGAVFTFGDGSPEQKRDAKIENNGILKGISTTSKKAEVLEGLTAYYERYGEGRALLCYGNIPAFPYYLEAETAIGSAWPDLDTYAMYDYRADMRKLSADAGSGVYPLIFIYAGLDEEDRAEEKYVLLQQFIEQNGYNLTEEIGDILIYDREEKE